MNIHMTIPTVVMLLEELKYFQPSYCYTNISHVFFHVPKVSSINHWKLPRAILLSIKHLPWQNHRLEAVGSTSGDAPAIFSLSRFSQPFSHIIISLTFTLIHFPPHPFQLGCEGSILRGKPWTEQMSQKDEQGDQFTGAPTSILAALCSCNLGYTFELNKEHISLNTNAICDIQPVFQL